MSTQLPADYKKVKTRLDALNRLIATLEDHPALTTGDMAGLLARKFLPPYPSHEEGVLFAWNQRWEVVFQPGTALENEPKHLLVCKGRYGIQLAHTFALHFWHLPEMQTPFATKRMLSRIKQLTDLINETCVTFFI